MQKVPDTAHTRTAKQAKDALPKARRFPTLRRSTYALLVAAAVALSVVLGATCNSITTSAPPAQSYSPELQERVEYTLAQHSVPPLQDDVTLSADGRYYRYHNAPDFGELATVSQSFEYYSPLDKLGRCGVAVAYLGRDLMPTEDRESISKVKPTGWHSDRYDFISQGYLYNRCHLIAFSLAGENANELNLITGTRQLNLVMSDFEAQIASYIRSTDKHVLYRVTPDFQGSELVARGVQLEALSTEDGGRAISYNLYIPNEQEGVGIDYATGDNWPLETASAGADTPTNTETDTNAHADASNSSEAATVTYVLNTSSKKFHYPWCEGVTRLSSKNRHDTNLSREELIAQGFSPCGTCKP